MRSDVGAAGLLVLLSVLTFAVTCQAQAVDMDFQDTEIVDVLKVLGELAGLNLVADSSVTGKVNFHLQDMDVMQAIDLITRTNGYGYKVIGKTLIVAPRERLLREFTEEQIVVLKMQHISPGKAQQALSAMGIDLSVFVDEGEGTLVLRGPADSVARAREVIAQLDQPKPLRMDFSGTPILDAFKQVAKAAGLNLIAGEGLEGTISTYIADMPVEEAIRMLASQAGVEVQIQDDVMYVAQPGEAGESSASEVEIFKLEFVSPQKVASFLGIIAPDATAQADEQAGLLVVRAKPSDMEAIRSFIARYDLPTVRVQGVISMDERSIALVTIDGERRSVRVGDHIGGLEVTAITTSGITLVSKDGGAVYTFEVGGSEGK